MSHFTFEREMEEEFTGDRPRIPSLETREVLVGHELELLQRWLLRAQPGSRRVYHEGQLAVDRQRDPLANQLAAVMQWAEMMGLVVLVQRRTSQLITVFMDGHQIPPASESTFEYSAYRTSVLWELPMPAFDRLGRWRHNGNSAVMGIAEGEQA